MPLSTDNVIPFPAHSSRPMSACPSCGMQTDLWRIGRLLWGYCDEHEVRWVVADFQETGPATIDLVELREKLQRLSELVEVTH